MRYMYSHLENLEREVDGSFRKKSEILLRHKERLSKQINDIRTKYGKVMTDFIGRQKHSLQNMNVKCTLMEQEGNASTSTGKVSDSDALKTRYIDFLNLENELERELLSGISVAKAKHRVEDFKFFAYNEKVLDLGTFNAFSTWIR